MFIDRVCLVSHLALGTLFQPSEAGTLGRLPRPCLYVGLKRSVFQKSHLPGRCLHRWAVSWVLIFHFWSTQMIMHSVGTVCLTNTHMEKTDLSRANQSLFNPNVYHLFIFFLGGYSKPLDYSWIKNKMEKKIKMETFQASTIVICPSKDSDRPTHKPLWQRWLALNETPIYIQEIGVLDTSMNDLNLLITAIVDLVPFLLIRPGQRSPHFLPPPDLYPDP